MIKEIHAIANEMISLNSQVHGTILSEKDLNTLKNALINIQSIHDNIQQLLEKTSLSAPTDTAKTIQILTKIHKSLSELAIFVEIINALSSKFVCNYREEWNIIKNNQA